MDIFFFFANVHVFRPLKSLQLRVLNLNYISFYVDPFFNGIKKKLFGLNCDRNG